MADLWQMIFNITKCYHLGITSKTVPSCHDYLMNDQTISKYQGITLIQILDWNQNCDLICRKANETLGLLRRVLGDCNTDVKSKAYVSPLAVRIYQFCMEPLIKTKHNINKIDMVQHRAARFV